MYCSKCNKKYDDSWKVCFHCTGPLDAVSLTEGKKETKQQQSNDYETDNMADWHLLRNGKTFYLDDFKICKRCKKLNLESDYKCYECGNSEGFVGLNRKLFTSGLGKDATQLLKMGIGALLAATNPLAGSYIIYKSAASGKWGNKERDKAYKGLRKQASYLLDRREKEQEAKQKDLVCAGDQWLFHMHQTEKALAAFKEAQQLGDKNYSLSIKIAKCYCAMGEFDEAIKELESFRDDGVSVDSQLIEILIQSYVKVEIRKTDAISFIEDHYDSLGVDLRKSCIEYLSQYYLSKKNDFDCKITIEILKEKLLFCKDDYKSRLLLMKMLYETKQHDQSIQEGRIILARQENDEAVIALAKNFLALGSMGKEAMEIYEKALSKTIDIDLKIEVIAILGKALVLKGNFDKAANLYELFLRGNPDVVLIRYHLALAYGKIGKVDEQIEQLQELLKKDLTNTTIDSRQALKVIVKAFIERKMYEVAYSQLAQLVLDDEVMDLLYELGNICETTDPKQAKKCYHKLIAKNIKYKDVVKRLDLLEKVGG
ncbi:MAG: tetratricopeptide repeat protein [PVC group bacterium]|nr:tetratricopeptide repeat protein [PVC group bacterium]